VISRLQTAVLAAVLSALALATAPEGDRPALDPRYSELDFWLGEWDVFDEAGRKVGSNVVRKVLKGRLVVEEWTDAFGREGRGSHFYDPARKKWRLLWIEEGGGIKEKEGGPAPGADMRVEGEVTRRDGTTALDRTTLTKLPDGRVRQSIEWSADGGKTWTQSFLATYVRRP